MLARLVWLAVVLVSLPALANDAAHAPEEGFRFSVRSHYEEMPDSGCCRIDLTLQHKVTVLASDGTVSRKHYQLLSFSSETGTPLKDTIRAIYFPEYVTSAWFFTIGTESQVAGERFWRQASCDREKMETFFPLGSVRTLRFPCRARSQYANFEAVTTPEYLTEFTWQRRFPLKTGLGEFQVDEIRIVSPLSPSGEPLPYASELTVQFSADLGLVLHGEGVFRKRGSDDAPESTIKVTYDVY